MAAWLASLVSDISAGASALIGLSTSEHDTSERVRDYQDWLSELEGAHSVALPRPLAPSLLALRSTLAHTRYIDCTAPLVTRARHAVLALLADALRALATIDETRVLALLVDVIAYALTRPELHVTLFQPNDAANVTAFTRYYRMLHDAYSAVSTRLSTYAAACAPEMLRVEGSASTAPLHLELLRAYVRLLAIATLRIPNVAQRINVALEPRTRAFTPSLSAYERASPSSASSRRTRELEAVRSVDVIDAMWQRLSDAVSPSASASPSASSSTPTPTDERWLTWLASDSSLLLVLLLREWVTLVSRLHAMPRLRSHPNLPDLFLLSTPPPAASLHCAKLAGYGALRDSFLEVLKRVERITLLRVLHDALLALIGVEPRVLNCALHHVFTRTSAYDLPAVSDALAALHAWFRALLDRGIYLDSEFDTDFFCRVLDGLIQTEHHQVLARAMQLLHGSSHVFIGEARRAVLSDWLLKQHFFSLFLHWDEVVRNYFHQFIFWKICRLPWRLISEVAEKDTSLPPSAAKLLPPIDPDGEFMTDRALVGKIRAYIQLVSERQVRQELLAYIQRALREWRWLNVTYQSQQEKDSSDWKLTPLALLDSRSLA